VSKRLENKDKKMKLETLEKVKNIRKAKRLGRGESSGKGKTSGKGYKGQKVRGSVRLGFEGGQLPIIKRLPFRRGIGNNLSLDRITLTLTQLSRFSEGTSVDEKLLLEKGLIKKSARPRVIKIVANGEINNALKVHFPATKKAKSLIEKAGGEVVLPTRKVSKKEDADN
jgi:large subunit ribosomal protein L15